MTGEYVDDSKNILQELGIEDVEDEGVEFQVETGDDEEIQMFQKVLLISLVPSIKLGKCEKNAFWVFSFWTLSIISFFQIK